MIIIQISDFHFGDNLNPSFVKSQIKEIDFIEFLLQSVIKDFPGDNEIVFVLLGDFANKSFEENYRIAKSFFASLEQSFKNFSISYTLCPGNHDLNLSSVKNPFGAYNAFSIHLTKDDKFVFNDSKTTTFKSINNCDFISVNTVFHKSHEHGLIDIDSLKETFKSCSSSCKLVLLHHNIIPIVYNNNSTVKNSYEFIRLCLENEVNYILHGHIHSGFVLNISGNSNKFFCKIIGVGSFLGPLTGNFNNQYNIMSFGSKNKISKIINYRLVYDSYLASHINTLKEKLM